MLEKKTEGDDEIISQKFINCRFCGSIFQHKNTGKTIEIRDIQGLQFLACKDGFIQSIYSTS